jgi:hypothetical protein
MWLEQTVWIWAPLAAAVLIWTAFRLAALGRDLRKLQMRVSQLEQVNPSNSVKITDRIRSAA